MGLGSLALTGLLNERLFAVDTAWTPSANVKRPEAASTSLAPHFVPRARAVIAMHMIGAPSQLDLLDPKPALQKFDGQPCPRQFIEGKRFAFIRGHPRLLGSPFTFKRCGRSGLQIGDLLPHLQGLADDLAIVRSVHTEEFNHGPA